MQNLSKTKLLGRYGRKAKRKRRAPPSVTVPESGLQKQMNDTLAAYNVKYLRISDNFWNELRRAWKAGYISKGEYYRFCATFAGMPDNMGLIQISDNYNLNGPFELKTVRGKLNPDQRKWKKETAVQVLRSTEENENAVVDFVKIAGKLRKLLDSSDTP